MRGDAPDLVARINSRLFRRVFWNARGSSVVSVSWFIAASAAAMLTVGCASPERELASKTLAPAHGPVEAPALQLTSSAFKDGDPIPQTYTADGQDISPPLFWAKVPQQARELA